MATTHYVPVERRNLPTSDPLRWLILPVETGNPVEAIREATKTAREMLGRGNNTTIWAAVTYIPCFAEMQRCRDEMDQLHGYKAAVKAKRHERVRAKLGPAMNLTQAMFA